MKTLSKLQDALAKKRHGKKATPILVEDKSIEGLIRANCKVQSKLFTFRLLALNLIP